MKWLTYFLVLVVTIILSVKLYLHFVPDEPLVNENPADMIDSRIVLAPSDKNDYEGYYRLAKDYYEGKKIKQDYVKVLENFSISCALKYGLACLEVAYLHNGDLLGERDKEKASAYFEKACDYGYASGCKNWDTLN